MFQPAAGRGWVLCSVPLRSDAPPPPLTPVLRGDSRGQHRRPLCCLLTQKYQAAEHVLSLHEALTSSFLLLLTLQPEHRDSMPR